MGCACIKTCSRTLFLTEVSTNSPQLFSRIVNGSVNDSENTQENVRIIESEIIKDKLVDPKLQSLKIRDCKFSQDDSCSESCLLSAQFALLTRDLLNEPEVAQIILESSIIVLSSGQVAILPWSDFDKDIKNNFWYNKDPPFYKLIPKSVVNPPNVEDICVSSSHPSDRCQEKIIHSVTDSMSSYDVYLNGWHLIDKKWTDPDGHISLSKNQQQKFHAWKRISALIETNSNSIVTNAPNFLIRKVPQSSVIRQGFIGDCSFLASLASLAEYEKKFNVPIISSILHPQIFNSNTNKPCPVYNSKGIYACRLHFNGVFRKVLVDDYVPVNAHGKILAAHSSVNGEFWVTLMEKCFAKLLGGTYAIQGSNPGSDLYHLTGWIPDTIPFQSDVLTASPCLHKKIITGTTDFELTDLDKWNDIWDSLYNGLCQGRCVACLGTSDLANVTSQSTNHPENVCQKSGIVAKHAYSIVNCAQAYGHKLLYVKNPWCCTRWKRQFSPYDKKSWTKDLQNFLKYNIKEEREKDDGYFWISWESVIQWFSHLYICWNPKIFKYNINLHSKWAKTKETSSIILADDTHLLGFNPQFQLQFENTENVDKINCWLLLSHHVCDRSCVSLLKYLALHVYAGKELIISPATVLHHGIYSNGECTLVKLVLLKSDTNLFSACKENNCDRIFQATHIPLQPLVVVVSQYSQRNDFQFTLRVSSNVPATLSQIPSLVQPTTISKYHKGYFTAENAGGSSNDLVSYLKNPHLRLYLPYDANITMILECIKGYSVNIRIFTGIVATPRALRLNNVISSGPYRTACCYIKTFAGCYTVVPSTFNKDEISMYQLSVFCEKGCADFEPVLKSDSNSELFSSHEISIFDLPTPYINPSINQTFYHLGIHSSDFERVSKSNPKFVIRIKAAKPASIRLDVISPLPSEAILGMTVYRVTGSEYRNICKSDLEGGYAFRDHSISSTGLSIYENQKYSTISHITLNTNLFPYYVCIGPVNIVHHNLYSPILSQNEELEFDFNMHIFSDENLCY